MEKFVGESMHPGAHIKYAVDIFGLTFEPFSFCPPNDKVKKVIIEKEEPGNPNNTKCFLTFHLGPIASLEEAKSISDIEKNTFIDILSFELIAKIGEPQCIEHNLIPRPGEGTQFHGILPPLQVHATGTVGYRKVKKEEIDKIKRHIYQQQSKNKQLLSLYRQALLINDVVSQFLMLYLILDVKVGDRDGAQKKIDNLLRTLAPSIEESPDPRNSKRNETCYTRLRNEITHRGTDPEKTFSEILECSHAFKHLVKLAIQA